MKTTFTLQHNHIDTNMQHYIDIIKQNWKDEGNFIKDIATLDTYINVSEMKLYYVINGEYSSFLHL